MLKRPTPALVVSGFLGSGKTTLVRHLLSEAARVGKRLAVISNEFGKLGIDRALLGSADDAYVELEGGCVCCKLSSELIETLETLRERVNPDAIVVETSGVALPGEVQVSFWRPPVSSWIGDDVAVVVVNAEQLLEGRDLDATFETQASSADLLLLNQIDRVPARDLPRLEARLREIEPDAPVIRTLHGQVPFELLFPPDLGGTRASRRLSPPAAMPHAHADFAAGEREFAAGIDSAELIEALRAEGALRAKGFVRTAQGLRLVQGVGHRIELGEVSFSPPSDLIGRVVVITRAAAAGHESEH